MTPRALGAVARATFRRIGGSTYTWFVTFGPDLGAMEPSTMAPGP